LVFLEHLQSVLEDAGPMVVREDEILQTIHDDRVKRRVPVHPISKGFMWVIYV